MLNFGTGLNNYLKVFFDWYPPVNFSNLEKKNLNELKNFSVSKPRWGTISYQSIVNKPAIRIVYKSKGSPFSSG